MLPKYALPEEQGVIIAPMVERFSPAIVEPGLVAYLMVSKFIDHLPFYRLSKMFERDLNHTIPQSTMNGWFKGAADALERLYDVLKSELLDSQYLQADESPMKVLERDTPKGITKDTNGCIIM